MNVNLVNMYPKVKIESTSIDDSFVLRDLLYFFVSVTCYIVCLNDFSYSLGFNLILVFFYMGK